MKRRSDGIQSSDANTAMKRPRREVRKPSKPVLQDELSNRQHVSRLRRIFEQGALERQAEENYLLVQCSAEGVARMLSHLEDPGLDPASEKVLSFRDWMSINQDEKIEVMAGQHRIEALREYIKQIGADTEEWWWTCEIYDRDKLPPELDVRLRVNRPDPSLPDSHGQTWMQLVLAANYDATLFQGKKAIVEKQMASILRLHGDNRFPTSRLVTLWKNIRWRSMITRWCETRVGRATFNVSTWDWMASCRIDNHWFSTFEQVLDTLREMPGNMPNTLSATDWAKMVTALPNGYSAMEVKTLFYPGQQEKVEPVTEEAPSEGLERRKDFLEEVCHRDYHRLCHYLSQRLETRFPDVQRLLKTTKEEGKIMMQVMTHVVAWVNPRPAVVMDRRENNKPLIREDLIPVLKFTTGLHWKAGGDNVSSEDSLLEQRSIDLERRVLVAVGDGMALFKTPAAKASLEVFPTDHENDYGQRFTTEPWKIVLEQVEQVLGPRTRSLLTFALPRHEIVETRARRATSSMTRAICALLPLIPEVVSNPGLNNSPAYEDLGASIDEAVMQWAARRGGQEQSARELNLESPEHRTTAQPIHQQTPECIGIPSLIPDSARKLEALTPTQSRAKNSQVAWPSFRALFFMNED
ncbi:hypothetical protein G7046_g2927 [Stylonectria norvegica]|nr:hypothetical protein G7046_g2927 [Stylonectria norvegica]